MEKPIPDKYEVVRQNGDVELVEIDKCPRSCRCCRQVATGIARTTDCYLREIEGVWEARQGVAIMGYYEKSKTDNPFDAPDGLEKFDPKRHFIGNYASGRGVTKSAAIKDMLKWMTDQSDVLFAE